MESKILKHVINSYITKKFRNVQKQRKFLIDCIQSSGYINVAEQSNKNSDEDEYEDLYEHIIPSSELVNSHYEQNNQSQQSFQEQQQSSVDPYGFHRTFIHVNSHSADKLAELQKRGITYEETQFIKVKEQMESILEKFDVPNKIIQTALNIFLNILIYYKQNPYGFTDVKGSLKKGYILLCIYYSLIYNNFFIEKEKLIQDTLIRLKDIPLADKNIKLIFQNVPGYSFLYNKFHGSIKEIFGSISNPKMFLSTCINIKSKDLLKTIENVIEETNNFIPPTKLGIYSVVYYVCNNYFPYRVKIIYSILNNVFEPFASATVRKLTDKISEHYKK